MPYIPDADRAAPHLAPIRKVVPQTPGELAYCVWFLAQRYDPRSFADLAHVLGALDACRAEFYRRVVAPYEDAKRAENGDVLDYIYKTLPRPVEKCNGADRCTCGGTE